MPKLPRNLHILHLARVVESSDDAIVSKDLDGIITSWNRAAERMFGYTAAEAVGRSIRMLIPPDLQSEEDVVLAKIRAGESVDHYETVRQRKDGTSIIISLTVSPIRNEAGEVLGASKVARDITERVRLLASVKEHAAITEKLSQVGVAVASTLDRDVIVKTVIDTATELTRAEVGAFLYTVRDPESGETRTQCTPSGLAGDAFALFPARMTAGDFGPSLRGESTVRLDDVTQDGRVDDETPRIETQEGALTVRGCLAVPVKGASGEVLGRLLFGHSKPGAFTGQHERIAEGIAGWASVALENARLYIEARDANRMKDEFLAVLSHELRTPLNAIVGYARLVRGGILSGERAERGIEILERNATLLTQIVEDVLDVSRIVSGKIRLDVQALELPLIVHNSVATVKPAADARGVRVHTIMDSRLGPVSGDAGRLQQVVWNLLSNAVKFTPRGGLIEVRVRRVDSSIEIAVSDTGMGIRPEFLPHVFERFRQAEVGTTRKTGGLGLGLAIVRHIVEAHGGTVHADSAGEGKGATFTVRLPMMIVHPGTLGQTREHPHVDLPPLRDLTDLHGIHAFAVDDEPDALNLLRLVLEMAGARVTTASSAARALDQIGAAQPDVLLVDLGMPGMDGFELITRIRAHPDGGVRDVPAAALTALARSEDRTRALKSGFEMHLAKPVDPGELVASVATLVRRSRTVR